MDVEAESSMLEALNIMPPISIQRKLEVDAWDRSAMKGRPCEPMHHRGGR